MYPVFKRQANGNILMRIGNVRKLRQIGDRFRLRSCLYPLIVVDVVNHNGQTEIHCDYANAVGMREIYFCRHDYDRVAHTDFYDRDEAIAFAQRDNSVTCVQHWSSDGTRSRYLGNIWERS